MTIFLGGEDIHPGLLLFVGTIDKLELLGQSRDSPN